MTNIKPDGIQEIIKTVLKGYDLSEKDLVLIFDKLKYIEVKKGEKFLKANRVCDKVGILLKGLLMANFETHNDKINVSRFFFHPDNIIVTSFESFKSGKVSNETIEAIEGSVLLYLTPTDLNFLYETIPAINKIGRQFAEDSYIKALQRIHDLQVYNITERVQKFFKKYPDLYNRVHKNQLASYLRVNRNDLTKAINKLDRK